jgi:hypothetical protein
VIKSRKKQSLILNDDFCDVSLFEAIEAVRVGEARHVASGLTGLADNLARLADQLEAKVGTKPALRFVRRPHKTLAPSNSEGPLEDEEWVSSPDQGKQVIEGGSEEGVILYLRDGANFLRWLATAVDPPPLSKDWRLKFHRRGAGRRRDPAQFWRDRAISQEVHMLTPLHGKQEAAIAEVIAERGISRAKIMRALRRGGRASHKKK